MGITSSYDFFNYMINENKNCWVYSKCNHIDCDTFCVKHYKQDYLYQESLINYKDRFHLNLRVDADGTDLEEFKQLKEIENNIIEFIGSGNNLYLHSSNTGTGKTSWGYRLIQSYFNKIWNTSELKCRALFINVPRFLLELKSNISTKSEYVSHIQENVLEADFVIWDEIGTKGLTQFEHENILSLINTRLERGLSNMYISNLSGEELHECIGDRLYSRIVTYSLDIELHGSDKRGIWKMEENK